MSTREHMMAKALAPEDIRAGSYVAILDVMEEYLPVWCLLEPYQKAPTEPLRFRWLPCDRGFCNQLAPMKVVEACLPFVFVRTAKGEHRTLDVRRHRLAQLPEDYGRKVFKLVKRGGRGNIALEE
jgi:hypothetical protein